MTRAEFEADLVREGYEVREGEIKPNVHREAHAHGFDARVFVLDGSITLVFGKERVTYGPGDSCSVPAGTMHEEHTEGDGVRFVSGRRPVTEKTAAHQSAPEPHLVGLGLDITMNDSGRWSRCTYPAGGAPC
jgi:quercetin dioxygenase-like cupin family protein